MRIDPRYCPSQHRGDQPYLRHQFIKGDGTLAAIINIDGAWIDMAKRKLAVPNEFVQNIFATFPKAPDFQLIVPEKKV